MQRGHLSDYFDGVVVKQLSVVETTPTASHQHEFNGSIALRRLLGDDDRLNMPTRFIRIDDETGAVSADGVISWYDARRRHPTRTEYRLYYKGNEVTGTMQPGDSFFLALDKQGRALIILTSEGSTTQNQLMWLFGLERKAHHSFTYQAINPGQSAELNFIARYILDELGIEASEPEAAVLDRLIAPFGLTFPRTREFSDLARNSLPEVSALDDPDMALVAWMDREEQLFRRLERRIVAARIEAGFRDADGADVDGFIAFTLSVQNRRKARVGQALENHLEAVLLAHGIRYARGAETENRNKPDFLFPGQAEYRDPAFPADRLTMLGAKSTVKDRWRQVLSEAARIEAKHLLTLEPGISENQTDEMRAKSLQLVIPHSLHQTYRPQQQPWLIDFRSFLNFLRSRQ